MNQQAERRVGTVIGGKWRVDALLGSGSMAAVYGVTHRNGARAALKILHPTLCTDPAVCERFLGEGYLANSVKHSGIVRVLDDGVTDDGCVFLVMDLLEGETLEGHRQTRGGKIPLPETLDLADKLMDVLSAVHAAGIIHRDLKPQNVFVCEDGTLKLLDFGVARVFDRTSQSKLSMFGLVLGTPSFMSPEQALGSRDKVDHRSDIWSLGATIFTALTGETVHLGANVQAKLLAAATVKARSIAMVMPDLPASLASSIDMSLRFKKEDRWQTVDAMRRSFREAREALGLLRPQTPAHAFDMSLDESTHVDNGQGFDPSTTVRTSSDAPGDGPGGTFIGIGSSDGKITSVVGNDGSVPPARLSPSAHPGHAGHPSAHPGHAAQAGHAGLRRQAGPSQRPPPPRQPTPGVSFRPAPLPGAFQPAPAAVVRRIGGPDPARASRADGQESIPAYGSTLQHGPDDSPVDAQSMGVPRRGSLGVWLLAVLLAATALGGIAFFAVKRGPLAGGGPSTSASPLLSSAPLPTSHLPTPIELPSATPNTPVVPSAGLPTTPTTIELPADSLPDAPDLTKDAGAAAHPVVAPPATARPTSRPRPKPATPAAPNPDAPPAVPPDPFGTPE